MRWISFLVLFFFTCEARSQDSSNTTLDRTLLSIMVRPDSTDKADLAQHTERGKGYNNALSVINSALIDMGYSRAMDPATWAQNVKDRTDLTHDDISSRNGMEESIRKAPVDIFIETAILWTDPPDNPRNKKVKMLLRAVDRYTGAIYATNGAIASNQREFPDLATAVEHALKNEGREEFKKFLDQLDNSYARVIREGRMVNMKFEIGTTSKLRLSERIDSVRLSDRIETCVHDNAFKGKYKLTGVSPGYMEFIVWVPVIDKNGGSVTPNQFMSRKVDDYFYQHKIQADCIVLGNWVNFILQQRD